MGSFTSHVEYQLEYDLQKEMAISLQLLAAPVFASVSNLDAALEETIAVAEAVDSETEPELVALEAILEEVTNPSTETLVAVSQEPQSTRWVGRNFTASETKVLEFFQDYGITDRAALAVLLGNVKQESRFETNICEGGTRPGIMDVTEVASV